MPFSSCGFIGMNGRGARKHFGVGSCTPKKCRGEVMLQIPHHTKKNVWLEIICVSLRIIFNFKFSKGVRGPLDFDMN
jgi:hypothetical protein